MHPSSNVALAMAATKVKQRACWVTGGLLVGGGSRSCLACHDFDTGTCSNPVGTALNKGLRLFESPDAPGCLHAQLRPDDSAHESNVANRCPTLGKPGGGLHE